MSWISVDFTGPESSGSVKQQKDNKKIILNYPCEGISHNVCYPLYLTIKSGVYNISLFGAKGGNSGEGKGGKGALSSAFLTLYKNYTFLFIYWRKRGRSSRIQI